MPSGTYPVPTPNLEVFGNCASCVTTSTYGTTNPTALTNETWTMGTGYTSFPTAQQTTSPYNFFYIRDPADTTNEICMVILGGGGTQTWSVIRGINGATVAHAALATWVQVISPYTLQNFKQAPGSGVSAVTVSNTVQTTNETVVAGYTPTATDLVPGSTWEIIAFGPFTWGGGSTRAAFQWTLYWGGSGTVGGTFTSTGSTALCVIKSATNTTAVANTTVAAGSSFDYNGSLTLVTAGASPVLTANANLFWNNSTALTAAAVNSTTTNSGSTGTSSATDITATSNATGPIILTFKWTATATAYSMVATAPIIYRAA